MSTTTRVRLDNGGVGQCILKTLCQHPCTMTPLHADTLTTLDPYTMTPLYHDTGTTSYHDTLTP
jgi:hypothetical protein